MAKEKETLNTEDMTDEELKKAAEDQSKAEMDSLLDDGKDPDDPDKKKDKEDEPTLEDRFANLEKENKGLYESMKAERGKRQELEGKMQGITDVFSESMARREELADQKKAESPKIDRLAVQVDDDGAAFIPIDDNLKALLASSHATGASKEDVTEIKNQMARNMAIQQQEQGFQDTVQSIVGEDPAYASAHNQLQKAADWFNDKIIRYQEANDLSGIMSTGEALDVAESENIESDFNKQFPGLDMERAVRMYDGKRDLRIALKSVAGTETPGGDKTAAANLKEIAGKASNLSQMRNQKGTKGTLTLDEIADRSDEIEDMSDEQVAKLHRLMATEEETA
ncbi:hypothetical protein LCGC14_0864630 [marine sediment metagenome]|uniref:Uncharacterized protein n=1 Tax=marine sediment metagenome TaxID=412755 RepID=A0A0F9PRW4_9ZZZZ